MPRTYLVFGDIKDKLDVFRFRRSGQVLADRDDWPAAFTSLGLNSAGGKP